MNSQSLSVRESSVIKRVGCMVDPMRISFELVLCLIDSVRFVQNDMTKIYLFLVLFVATSLATSGRRIKLDFSGLQPGEAVVDYFNGGFGSMGSGPGPKYGIRFLDGSGALDPGFVVDINDLFDVRDSGFDPSAADLALTDNCGTGRTRAYFKSSRGVTSYIFTSSKSVIGAVNLISNYKSNDGSNNQMRISLSTLSQTPQVFQPDTVSLRVAQCNNVTTPRYDFDGGIFAVDGLVVPIIFEINFEFKPDSECQPDPSTSATSSDLILRFDNLPFGPIASNQFASLGISINQVASDSLGGTCPDSIVGVRDHMNCLCTLGNRDTTNFIGAYTQQGGGCNTRFIVSPTSNFQIDSVTVYAEHFSAFSIVSRAPNPVVSVFNGTCRPYMVPFDTPVAAGTSIPSFEVQTSSTDAVTYSIVMLSVSCTGGRVLSKTTNPVSCVCPTGTHLSGGVCVPDCTDPLCCLNSAPRPIGSSCNDGNLCTTGDSCQLANASDPFSIRCFAGTPVVCTAANQCKLAGVCDSATGVCSDVNKPAGSSCDDGNRCTQTDTCQAGVCVGSNPVVCTALDQCHDAGQCNTATGVCTNPNKADGSSCTDGKACTVNDQCMSGVCMSGSPKVCNNTGSGTCVTPSVCVEPSGTCSGSSLSEGATCDDGNPCTVQDRCNANGHCYGSPTVCPPINQCRLPGVCNRTNGACLDGPMKVNGSPCWTCADWYSKWLNDDNDDDWSDDDWSDDDWSDDEWSDDEWSDEDWSDNDDDDDEWSDNDDDWEWVDDVTMGNDDTNIAPQVTLAKRSISGRNDDNNDDDDDDDSYSVRSGNDDDWSEECLCWNGMCIPEHVFLEQIRRKNRHNDDSNDDDDDSRRHKKYM
eukprot:TRINITY_DN177_c0_g1_i1.p1 TRINITY_DN177_c0_g1~~TRINITY_DN177_c0_g1_i1.p1  ORF type:complete len:864 (+),score=256.40 TRINITY_DN177_c0_g1_i1:474-3065(+)